MIVISQRATEGAMSTFGAAMFKMALRTVGVGSAIALIDESDVIFAFDLGRVLL